jgi:hypothetical protein
MGRAEVATLEQFASCWEGLEDPRQGNARLHDLHELLVIALCCVLCGGQGAVDMALFAEAKEPFLRGFLKLKNGLPKPGGGGRIPMAVRSRDGITWEHLPVYYEACHWTGCSGCTPQGCFAGRSSFVPFSRILRENANTAESLATFPGHILSSHWARTAKTLCILTQGTIECASLKDNAKLNTQDDLAEWSDENFPPLRNSRPAMLGSTSIEPALKPGVHCIRCGLVNLYLSHEAKTGPAEIQINFTIGEGGGVRGFKVSGGIPKDVADKVKASALGWLFEPYEQNGKPKSVNVDIRGRIMIMNPDNH